MGTASKTDFLRVFQRVETVEGLDAADQRGAVAVLLSSDEIMEIFLMAPPQHAIA